MSSKNVIDYEYEILWGRERFHIIGGDGKVNRKVNLIMSEYFGFMLPYCECEIVGICPMLRR